MVDISVKFSKQNIKSNATRFYLFTGLICIVNSILFREKRLPLWNLLLTFKTMFETRLENWWPFNWQKWQSIFEKVNDKVLQNAEDRILRLTKILR